MSCYCKAEDQAERRTTILELMAQRDRALLEARSVLSKELEQRDRILLEIFEATSV